MLGDYVSYNILCRKKTFYILAGPQFAKLPSCVAVQQSGGLA